MLMISWSGQAGSTLPSSVPGMRLCPAGTREPTTRRALRQAPHQLWGQGPHRAQVHRVPLAEKPAVMPVQGGHASASGRHRLLQDMFLRPAPPDHDRPTRLEVRHPPHLPADPVRV